MNQQRLRLPGYHCRMPRGPPTDCSVALIADSRPLIVSYTSHHVTAPVYKVWTESAYIQIFSFKKFRCLVQCAHRTSGQIYIKWYFTSGVIHSLFGFPFSCTVPTVTNAQYITPNTINREIQINLRNITRETQQTFQTPLFGTHCEALQQPAAIETADNRKSCNCSGDSGDFLYIHIITVTGIIYRKKEKIWCKKLSPPKNTGD